MYSFAFPNMLSYNSSNLLADKDAIKSNLQLLLNVEKKSMFGDPAFGGTLRKAIFEQSRSLITDLLVDEIFSIIVTFMPQVYVERRNISLMADSTAVYAMIGITYRMDNTSDLLTIRLLEEDN